MAHILFACFTLLFVIKINNVKLLLVSTDKQVENSIKDIKTDKSANDTDDNSNEEDNKDEFEDDLINDLRELTTEMKHAFDNITCKVYGPQKKINAMGHFPSIIIPPPNA